MISMDDLSKEEILALLKRAAEIKKKAPGPILQGKVMGSCFFEPSTRTRLSFEAAMKRLGGEVIGFSGAEGTSAAKGESLADAIRVIGAYVDVVVLRHPTPGAALEAKMCTKTPVINAGDGANEHPTQTLLDLFTMQECRGSLEGVKIAVVGDLLHSRTVHSLVRALKHFSADIRFVAPPELAYPGNETHETLEAVIGEVDFLYMTRVQKERQGGEGKAPYILTPELLEKGKKGLKVLHPLPRQEEIDPAVDALEQAHYFAQAENGLYVRQALLAEVLK